MCQYTTNAGDKGLSVANVKPIQNTMLAVSADSSETKIPEIQQGNKKTFKEKEKFWYYSEKNVFTAKAGSMLQFLVKYNFPSSDFLSCC